VNRTEELRLKGHNEIGGGGGDRPPFVLWGETYAYVEGRVSGTFETKYGLAATLEVEAHYPGMRASTKNAEGVSEIVDIAVGEQVNVGTGSAALRGRVTEHDVNERFHIAFEGWEENSVGRAYRKFTVIRLGDDPALPVDEGPDEYEVEAPAPPADDGLPF
jgi:hypothetical protein